MTAEERAKLPESDFAGPNHSFPITSPEHVEAAAHLIGKAADPEAVKRKVIAIAKRKGFPFPEAWKDKATFATDMVERRGRVFKFGDWKDGNGRPFSLTREEFEAANPSHCEVPIGFDPRTKRHYFEETAFDGMYGHANLEVNGDFIDSTYRMRLMLSEVIDRDKLKVSAIFGRTSKQVLRVDVVDPRNAVYADATFDRACFATENEDEVVIFAEVPDPISPPGSTANEAEAELVADADKPQHTHEALAAMYPELCQAEPKEAGRTRMFAKSNFHALPHEDQQNLIQLHDLQIHHSARCPGMRSDHAQFATDEEPDMADENEELTAMREKLAALEAKDKERDAQFATIQQERQKERDRRILADTSQFATEYKDRIPTAALPQVLALFSTLASEDDTADVAVFGYLDGKERKEIKEKPLQLFRNIFASLPVRSSTKELVIERDPKNPLPAPRGREVLNGVMVFAGDEPEPVDVEQPTPDGQEIPKARMDHLAAKVKDLNANGSGRSFALPPRG
jgi:hypothetical protein